MDELQTLLDISAARHKHLCPRQVLGVRLGLAGGAALGLELPRSDKHLLVILETDGCFADGVEVATGCTVGHRTLRVADYGKVAATFIHVKTGRAVRLAPHLDVRARARQYAPEEKKRYFAQLTGYQQMPTEESLFSQEVQLTTTLEAIVSRPGVRVNCTMCGEEIINEREIFQNGMPLCLACAHGGYYRAIEQSPVFPYLVQMEAAS